MTPEERFWSKVEAGAIEECWPWMAARYAEGYGAFYYEGRTTVAHRVVYAWVHGLSHPALSSTTAATTGRA